MEQAQNYSSYKDELKRKGKQMPLNEVILIFDEAKVTSKVKWSSSGQKSLGLALTDEEFPLLHDVYEEANSIGEPLRTEYNPQFLWRDLTSDFGVIGPYFSSNNSYDHRFVIASVKETKRRMHSCDFLVVGNVCDGASTNLSAIKVMCQETRGVFGSDETQDDKPKIKAWFTNYFTPELKVYCCICPSHRLENMINVLYQSRDTPGGTKLFKIQQNLPYFGWRQIKDMYHREEARINTGQIRMVPGLLRSHIERDVWTKLAVFPAKNMQKPDVLREIYTYMNPQYGEAPHHLAAVQQTYQYLTTCNQLFEEGFLSHYRIEDINSEVLHSIMEGYKFFVRWHDALEGHDFRPTSFVECRFLAWQTWDLLRMCIYGFNEFCQDFLHRHPGYYIVPLKWNGSAVEMLLAQNKRAAGGN